MNLQQQEFNEITKILCERKLKHFIQEAWQVVEPATKFVDGWHIDLICEYLEAITCGKIKKLLVTIPPRHMKSLTISVFWPVWTWLTTPQKRWIFASYASDLAIRDSVKCRRIIESQWFQGYWKDRFSLTSDQNVKSRFENNHTGYRIATSVGGSVTGEGGDIVACDDPHNLKEIHSDLKRNGVLSWWSEVMSTRINDPVDSAKVVVMQRGHQNDLAGYLIREGGYTHLDLQAVAEENKVVYFPITKRKIERKENDILWEKKFPREAIEDLKKSLGSYAFAAQLQQRPTPRGGGIIKRKWFKYYKELPKITRTIQSWDTGFKTGQANDPSVCTTWGKNGTGYYLIDVWRGKVEFPELKRQTIALFNKHHPHEVIVEDKASGQSLVQEIQRDTNIPVIPIKVDTDKEARANAISPTIEAGNVYLKEDAHWLADFLDEVENFPNAMHDDQVDSMTQALSRILRLDKNPYSQPRITQL